jgi:hypothetical protein
VKQVSYNEEETVYVAGYDVEDAMKRRGDHRVYGYVEKDTPQEAWNALGYWEQEEEADKFEVFKFVTSVQVTKVDPPYTPRS